jgi:hypothetical protein
VLQALKRNCHARLCFIAQSIESFQKWSAAQPVNVLPDFDHIRMVAQKIPFLLKYAFARRREHSQITRRVGPIGGRLHWKLPATIGVRLRMPEPYWLAGIGSGLTSPQSGPL